jgi:predicted transcriptional regulator
VRKNNEEFLKLAKQMYSSGYTVQKIATLLPLNSQQIKLYLRLNGIKLRSKKSVIHSQETEQQVIKLYKQGNNIQIIRQITKVSCPEISYILQKNNIKINLSNKKYTLNESIFECIDTEEKAYWLGFMYADGTIYSHGKNNLTKRISLTLQKGDIEHLNNFKSFLGYSGDIIEYEAKTSVSSVMRPYCKISLCSVKMYNDLNSNGCVNKKTLILEFPSEKIVPGYLQKHFIRGIFDGDGCIRIDESATPSIQFLICGTYNICSTIRDVFVKNNINMRANVHEHSVSKLTKHPLYELKIKGNKVAMQIFDWLYEDSTIFMKRKHDIYISHKKMITNCRLEGKPLRSLVGKIGKSLNTNTEVI